MKKYFYILILTGCFAAIMQSCKTNCPLPSCQIRTKHHHALNFKNTKSFKKSQEKEAKRLKKEQIHSAKAREDSIANAEQERLALENLDADHDKDLQKVKVVQEVAHKDNPKDNDLVENKKKKKKKKGQEEELEDVNQELASTDKAAKKELKSSEKESKKLQKESDRIAKKEKSETEEAEAVYKSRMLPWWKKNQNPKVGQDYDLPAKKEVKNKNEYTW